MLKYLRDKTFDVIFKDFIKFLISWSVLSLLGNTFIYSYFTDFFSSYLFLTVTSIIALTAIFSFFIVKQWLRLMNHNYVHSNFRVLHKEIKYKYNKSLDSIEYYKTLTLQAKVNSIDTYQDKYSWSGAAKMVKISSEIQGHSINETGQSSLWEIYETKFGYHLKKDETIKISTKWEMSDIYKTPTPFFSADISENTKKLILILILPKSLDVDTVFCEKSSSIASICPISREVKELTEMEDKEYKTIRWEIQRPEQLYHYQIRWQFPPSTRDMLKERCNETTNTKLLNEGKND